MMVHTLCSSKSSLNICRPLLLRLPLCSWIRPQLCCAALGRRLCPSHTPGGSHTRMFLGPSHCTTCNIPPARGVLLSTRQGSAVAGCGSLAGLSEPPGGPLAVVVPEGDAAPGNLLRHATDDHLQGMPVMQRAEARSRSGKQHTHVVEQVAPAEGGGMRSHMEPWGWLVCLPDEALLSPRVQRRCPRTAWHMRVRQQTRSGSPLGTCHSGRSHPPGRTAWLLSLTPPQSCCAWRDLRLVSGRHQPGRVARARPASGPGSPPTDLPAAVSGAH